MGQEERSKLLECLNAMKQIEQRESIAKLHMLDTQSTI